MTKPMKTQDFTSPNTKLSEKLTSFLFKYTLYLGIPMPKPVPIAQPIPRAPTISFQSD